MIKKNILVVDDSAVVRRYLVKLLKDTGYEVDIAHDGEEALQKLRERKYSLVTLDFEMPRLNGLETLKEIMQCCPTRVIMISAYTTDSADLTFEALSLGAIDYILKPKSSVDIAKISDEILKKVHNALIIPIHKLKKQTSSPDEKTICIDSSIDMGFVLIGASTGGPRLIEKICKSLPANYPHCVCVVQHMPEDFTANFAKRLNSLSKVEVLEADNDLELKPSQVIIAKGGWHLHFKRKLKQYYIKLAPNSANRFFVPSVDEMFFSAASILPAKKILAIELTGIGDDGADGMVELRKQGAMTLAESEKTAVVYGMPKEAYERGGAQKVLDFDDIIEEIIRYGQL
ncbi:MAG: chemotaxis-specific protein-glutamate methyltransferase CheB [Epsilonproteobacteria bacterium]|nr:chemotaxis-specific protein-glutamate methyltransferase CheB [Campylobacterota bacterium]